MTFRQTVLVAAGGSAALLIGAYAFQALGYAPCKMCLWQRWPHFAAIGIGALAALTGVRVLALVGAAAALTTAGIGLFHTGVERGWWEGPTSCTGSGPGLGGLSGSDLLNLDVPKLVMCDQVSWSFAGLSMASWNAVLSLALVAIWIAAYRRRGPSDVSVW